MSQWLQTRRPFRAITVVSCTFFPMWLVLSGQPALSSLIQRKPSSPFFISRCSGKKKEERSRRTDRRQEFGGGDPAALSRRALHFTRSPPPPSGESQRGEAVWLCVSLAQGHLIEEKHPAIQHSERRSTSRWHGVTQRRVFKDRKHQDNTSPG